MREGRPCRAGSIVQFLEGPHITKRQRESEFPLASRTGCPSSPALGLGSVWFSGFGLQDLDRQPVVLRLSGLDRMTPLAFPVLQRMAADRGTSRPPRPREPIP